MICDRYRQLKQQYDLKAHEAELLSDRLKQGTHHQQLTEIEALEKSIGKFSSELHWSAVLAAAFSLKEALHERTYGTSCLMVCILWLQQKMNILVQPVVPVTGNCEYLLFK